MDRRQTPSLWRRGDALQLGSQASEPCVPYTPVDRYSEQACGTSGLPPGVAVGAVSVSGWLRQKTKTSITAHREVKSRVLTGA